MAEPTPPTRAASTAPSKPRPQPMKKANKPFLAIKWTVLALLTSVALSRALTQTWTWGYEGKWTNPKKIMELVLPSRPLVLSEQQLAFHDGTNPRYPLYIALDGDVFDVSDGGMGNYGPGGAYHVFAGRDAARAFVTGCFQDHLTHDLRGFTEKDMKVSLALLDPGLADLRLVQTLNNWKSFYAKHPKYHKVGTVIHRPIDPSSPIPAPCNQGKDQPGEKVAGN
ncbi:SPOSA6832_00534 [Sporobolomyces salmonicolor]|uniref:SPOSA6832_00534-mRNA-1:cds n=1 Tax=Sporidiobolus salmonicolor TaxID=5005 RepID=A0A0D6EGE0_SPOSA|nr:SPOSA6832_00534 [Sporobolomyces salmonicolor]